MQDTRVSMVGSKRARSAQAAPPEGPAYATGTTPERPGTPLRSGPRHMPEGSLGERRTKHPEMSRLPAPGPGIQRLPGPAGTEQHPPSPV